MKIPAKTSKKPAIIKNTNKDFSIVVWIGRCYISQFFPHSSFVTCVMYTFFNYHLEHKKSRKNDPIQLPVSLNLSMLFLITTIFFYLCSRPVLTVLYSLHFLLLLLYFTCVNHIASFTFAYDFAAGRSEFPHWWMNISFPF